MKMLEELLWVEELLPDEVLKKHMFGGFAYYHHEKLILVIFENPGDNKYRGSQFDFDLWHGCMFPVERDFHKKALMEFPFLFPHPVLGKWLYLPTQTEDFDEKVRDVLRKVQRPSSFWGTIPKTKSPKVKSSKKLVSTKMEKVDTRRPRMFSDENIGVDFDQLSKISDLKNLGPAAEKEFLKVGIKTPTQFHKLGWEKAFAKLSKANPKNAHAVFAYALIGALKNQDWFRLSAEEKKSAQALAQKLRSKKRRIF